MKDLLFIVCTHGDESTPLEVLKTVIQEYGETNFYERCDYVIANPKALGKNIRFTEADLNRMSPGNSQSELYEERRAAELLEYAKQFRCVIDLHTTVADSGIFTLVTNGTENNNELARKLFPKKVVIWESISARKTGPITSYLDCACEIECSVSYPDYKNDLKKAIMSAITINTNVGEKEWYKVVGSLPEGEGSSFPGLKDFTMVLYREKSVYPLLTGRYSDKDCYLMEKIHDPLQTRSN